MRVRVVSDLHQEIEKLDLPEVPCDAVILAGDVDSGVKGVIWAQHKFPDLPVIYVAGNHEFYHHGHPSLFSELKEAAKGSNVTVLENEGTTINGVRFLGCTFWSNFELFGQDTKSAAMSAARQYVNDYRLIRLDDPAEDQGSPNLMKPIAAVAEHNRSLEWLGGALKEGQEPLVIVTHFAPSAKSVAEEFKNNILSAAFVSNQDKFVAESRAQVWIHGHTHRSFDYKLGDTQVVCNPRGYPWENTGFNPELVLDIPN